MGFFSFTRCIPNTLDICLHRLLSHFKFGQPRGVRSWGYFKVFCPSKQLAFQHPNYSGVSALVAGIFVVYIWRFLRKTQSGLRNLRVLPAWTDFKGPYRFSWGSPYCFRIASYLCSLFLGIIQSSWKEWLTNAINVPVILVPAFCYHSIATKKVSGYLFLVLQRSYSDGRLYSEYVRKERLI